MVEKRVWKREGEKNKLTQYTSILKTECLHIVTMLCVIMLTDPLNL